LRSPDRVSRWRAAPLRPLLAKELREIFAGRALWTMLLLLCPLMGYGFLQAVSLYGEASGAALSSPALALGLSPLDGVLVPTLGAFYVAVTLLFPFVAIRVLGHEKESGALRLLVQLPYRAPTLIAAKLAAVLGAWLAASMPAVSAVLVWKLIGGHVHPAETFNLLLGHMLYGLLVGAIALFSAAISDSAATAAIITLAFTIGSWVLDFTAAGSSGIGEWMSLLSLTRTLRGFEQGLLSAGLVTGIAVAVCGFATLAAIWLPPGVSTFAKSARSVLCVLATAALLLAAARIGTAVDVSEDRRNSFAPGDRQALAQLTRPLAVTIHLAPEDPRYVDFERNVLSKLGRTLPDVTVRIAAGRPSVATAPHDDAYGEIEYQYGGGSATSRSTSPGEILPLLYALGGVSVPPRSTGNDYPGYPLVANPEPARAWFFGVLPLVVIVIWWWTRRPPRIARHSGQQGDQP
jgi:ABC-type transport system involved in multi-copper enzyme maturation permease subunit